MSISLMPLSYFKYILAQYRWSRLVQILILLFLRFTYLKVFGRMEAIGFQYYEYFANNKRLHDTSGSGFNHNSII